MKQPRMKLISLVGLIAVVVLILVVLVKFVPGRTIDPGNGLLDFSNRPTSSYQIIQRTPLQIRCEQAGGKWTECGNPCHGKTQDVCITSCQPQCLCGGAERWTCPKDLACTDWEPNQADPQAIGVCRASVSTTTLPVSPSTSTLSIVRSKPSDAVMCDERNFICVHSVIPKTIINPLVVTGTAIAFESTINWQLSDLKGRVLQRGFSMASAPDVGKPGSFAIKLFAQTDWNLSDGKAIFKLYEASAKDGEAIHVVSFPVQFETQITSVKLFLTSDALDAASICNVEPTQREIIRSNTPIEAALTAFFAYQNPPVGYLFKSTPSEARLESLLLSNGTLTLTLADGSFDRARGGSALVGCIRAEIESTAKQFSSVKNVVIIEKGRTAEETLQP